jgi:hypothetical protein
LQSGKPQSSTPRWRGWAILGGLVLVILAVDAVAFRSWLSSPDEIRSREMGANYRVPVLGQHLPLKSEVQAAEFHIVPLATGDAVSARRRIDAVLKIRSNDLEKWTVGLPKVMEADLSWGYELLPAESYWEVQSIPQIHQKGDTIVGLYVPERIVMLRVISSE